MASRLEEWQSLPTVSVQQVKTEPTRVVVVDPLPLARYGLVALLGQAPGSGVVAEVSTADEALTALRTVKRSDNAILVVSLGLTGLHDSYWLIQTVRRSMPWIKILAAGADARSTDISRSLFEGADGFVDKTLECEVFLRAIHEMGHGSLVLETTTELDAGDVLRDLESQKQVATLLSEREREILLLAADGLTAKQIGVSLGLSDRTVTTHFGRIYSKLGVNSRLGAIRAATRCGAISSPTLVS